MEKITDDSPWIPIAVGLAFVIPIGMGLWYLATSNQSTGSGLEGSRAKLGGDTEEEIKEILKKIDPVDSLYFDVSVARHLLEEGNHTKALEWLDPNHALGELKKSYNANFLTAAEFDKAGGDIVKIKNAVEAGRIAEAHAIIVPLQDRLAEKAYTTFAKLDPITPEYIDSRYEAAREKKVAEWRAKGYSEAIIEKTLKWADEWSRGIATRFIKEPVMRAHVQETLYPEALELSDKWIEAMG